MADMYNIGHPIMLKNGREDATHCVDVWFLNEEYFFHMNIAG